MRFYKYSVEDGLSHSAITCITQDSLGFIWIGTQKGLNRFDGYSFQQFLNNSNDSASIPFNTISTIAVDKTGNLWIGSSAEGICYYNVQTSSFKSYTHNPDDKNTLSSNQIKHIICDASNNIWIATKNGGVNYFDVKKNKFLHYKTDTDSLNHIGSNRVRILLIDSKNKLWIGTYDKGLSCLDLKTNKFHHYSNKLDDKNSLSGNSVNHIYETSDGNIWVGTYSNGLNCFDIEKNTFTRYYNQTYFGGFGSKSVKWMLEDNKKRLWIGTWANGLYLFDNKKKQFRNYRNKTDNKYSISDSRVLTIFKDLSGQIWLGTQFGLNRIDPAEEVFKHYYHEKENENSLSNNYVYHIAEDKNNNLWIATYNGLNKYNKKENVFDLYKSKPNDKNSMYRNTTWFVLQDSKNRIWVGNTEGILRYNEKNNNFIRYKGNNNEPDKLKGNNFLTAIEDYTGKLWIGTWSAGINCFDPETGINISYTHDPNDPNSLLVNGNYSFYEDSKNRLWIGTDNGLNLFNRKENNFIKFVHNPDNEDGLPHNNIHAIYEDSNNQLWVSTHKGFGIFNPKNNTFSAIDFKNKSTVPTVTCIQEDQHKNLWLGTIQGICKYNPKQNSFVWFDEGDGLQGNEFNLGIRFENSEGLMYFGGNNGVSEFHPDSIKENSHIPPVVITKFLLFNKEVKPGVNSPLKVDLNISQQITLKHEENIFSFEFTALNYRQSKKNQFAYMLEGVNDDWIYTDYKYRRATYTRIEPGDYIFRVKASNDDGVWNNEGIAIKVTILPPWWETIWARTLWVLLVVGAVYITYRLRVSVLRKQKKILEQQVKERTEEILQQKEEIKAQTEELLATNEKLIELDEFKQGMTGMIVHDLKNPLNMILNTSKNEPIAALKGVKQVGRQMLNMVLNILDVQKYEETQLIVEQTKHSLYKLSKSAIEEVQFLLEQKQISLKNNIEQQVVVMADKEIIERVLVNFLTNAIKYTPANGKVELAANLEKKEFVKMTITDTGSGIPKKELSKVFDKFTQVVAKKSGSVHSTGLGLTFCELAVNAHGGKVGVESEVGKGSTFWFTLKSANSTAVLETDTVIDENLNNAELIISAADKKLIMPYFDSLKKLMVYETSEIEKILKSINSNESKAIDSWKKEITACLFSMNEERYKELINLVAV